jgi:hypothetical protein
MGLNSCSSSTRRATASPVVPSFLARASCSGAAWKFVRDVIYAAD